MYVKYISQCEKWITGDQSYWNQISVLTSLQHTSSLKDESVLVFSYTRLKKRDVKATDV